jgi:hypothetical protein
MLPEKKKNPDRHFAKRKFEFSSFPSDIPLPKVVINADLRILSASVLELNVPIVVWIHF